MRIVNRVLAVVVAFGLAVGGLVVAAEIGWAALGNDPWLIPYDEWYAGTGAEPWDSSGPRSLFVLLTLAGTLVLALQLVRRRPRSIPLPEGRARAGVQRRSLEAALVRAAVAQDGLAQAKASIGRRRARVTAVTRRTQGDLRPRVEEAARSCLRQVGVDGAVEVAVRVDRNER